MERIKIDDFYKYRYLSNIQLNKSGSKAAFCVKEVNLESNGYDSYIYIIKDDKVNKLTNNGKEASFIWLNDEEILFSTIRKDDKKKIDTKDIFTSFYKININGGEAIKEFELPLSVNNIELLDDGRFVVVASFDKRYPNFYKASEKKRTEILKEIEDNKDYEEVDERPFWFNGAGFVNGFRSGLFIYDQKTKSLERITGSLFDVNSYTELNGHLYYSGIKKVENNSYFNGLYDYDLKTKKTRTLLNPNKYQGIGIYKNKDNLYLLTNDAKDYGLNKNDGLYSFDINTLQMKCLKDDFTPYNSVGSDARLGSGNQQVVNNDDFYYVETRRNAAILSGYVNNEFKDFYTEEGSIECFDIKNDHCLMIVMTANKLQEVYSLDLKTKNIKQISYLNEEILKNKYVALPQKITINSCDTDIDGWILYPKDYDEKKKYPAVLDIHGGPKTVYGEVFYHEMQVLANMGYFVFYCNPIGSDGRGNKFSDIRGEYGNKDYQNIMDFTDAVLEKCPSIDQNKVCVTGGSYGGFMTNWIVGHTNRFVCAATQRSISNWISFYGVSDIGVEFANDQTASKGINLNKMWNQSPLKYVKNVKTPILFIHSDEDYRCPLEQGIQFYTSIKRQKVATKMVIFHGENHELSRGGKPTHRLKRLNEIINWFEKYTKEERK